MKFGKSGNNSTAKFQTIIRDGLDKGISQGEIAVFDFPYHHAASVNASISPKIDDDVLYYEILIINSFICAEGHFHVYHLAELTLGRVKGFNLETFNNLTAHLCADIISTWFKDSGNEPAN